MANIFSGSEIVEIGIQIEENGRDFYNALVAQSQSPKAKEVFLFLAGEEEKHIAVFKKILDTVEGYVPPESYPGEYFEYMTALAGEHVFAKKDQGKTAARKVKTDREAVILGMGFEKDSIIFYEGMKKAVPPHDTKVVDEIIAQEKKHLIVLTELKDKLS